MVQMLKKLRSDPDKLMDQVTGMHRLSEKMKATGKPMVAAIHGVCMGGGLEMALFCDYRVATNHKKTVMSVPEIKLGLFPGAGGTQNLPPLVGVQEAIKMMTMGGNVKPARAIKSGLIDQICEPGILEQVACDAARGLADGSLKPKKKKKSLMNKLLEDNPVGQYVLFDQAKKAITKATDGKYPAAYAVLDCVKEGLKGNKKAGLEYEAKRFVEMAQTKESHGLIGLFDGMTAMKKSPFGAPQQETKTVAVLGAGLMGAGIAQVTAKNAGRRVLLKDRDLEAAGRGEAIIQENFDKAVKRKRMTKHASDSTMANIVGLGDEVPSWGKHFNGVDMVIEAVFEGG